MSSIKKFWSRAELGMARPKSVSRNITPEKGGVAVHYGGAAQNVTTEAQARSRWLAYQKFHMRNNYADIAYTAGFDNWGNVYAGRGLGVRTGANGTNAANQNFYAFCWIGGGNEKPSDEALDALNWLIEQARTEGGAALTVKAHKDFKSTSCPGTFLTKRVREVDGKKTTPAVRSGEYTVQSGDTLSSIAKRFNTTTEKLAEVNRIDDPDLIRVGQVLVVSGSTQTAPKPEQAPTPPPSAPTPNSITVGDSGAGVRSWQSDLRKRNPWALPEHGVDGDFGAETLEWTLRFLDAVGLVPADRNRPRIGQASRDAMARELRSPKFGAYALGRTWSRGDRGSNVKAIQRELNRRGFGAGRVDGVFGKVTEGAVQRFQREEKIQVDGKVGPETFSRLI